MAGIRRRIQQVTSIDTNPEDILRWSGIDQWISYTERYDALRGWSIVVVRPGESWLVECDESLGQITVYH